MFIYGFTAEAGFLSQCWIFGMLDYLLMRRKTQLNSQYFFLRVQVIFLFYPWQWHRWGTRGSLLWKSSNLLWVGQIFLNVPRKMCREQLNHESLKFATFKPRRKVWTGSQLSVLSLDKNLTQKSGTKILPNLNLLRKQKANMLMFIRMHNIISRY